MLRITNPTITRKEVWTAFRRTQDVRVRERYHGLLLLLDGKTCAEIAQWLYRDEETIRSWVHAVNAAGLPGLERAPIPGRPTCLTKEQQAQLKEAVRCSPRVSGYNISLWTTKLVCHYISTRFGITYCRERARQVLHALGFRLRRLRHRHLRGKPAEQEAFVTELSTLLEDWPQDCELLFVDEATVRRHPTLTAQWCLSDDIPEVPTGDDHTKVHVYGAVAPLTGQTHYHISPTLGKGEFAHFLRHLLRYYSGKRLLVIHDGAEQHKGAPITKVLKDAEGRLSLKRQPAYSPELNPQERIWKWRRRVVTHNHWFETLSEETQALRDFFCYLIGRKTQIRHLCGLKTPESLLALL